MLESKNNKQRINLSKKRFFLLSLLLVTVLLTIIFSSFVPFNKPPHKPKLSYPENLVSEIPTTNITLKWSCSDPEGNKLDYTLYLSPSSTPTLYATDITSNQYTIHKTLKGHTVYFWKVIANDSYGAKSSSDIYKFTTKDNPPTKPTLTYPDNNQTDIATSNLTLIWNPSTDPDGDPITYDLYLSTDSNPKLYKSSLTDTSLLVKGLKSGRSYHWKIVAYDGLVKRTSSDIYTFSTVDTPPTIQLLSPGNYTTTTTPFSVTLSWFATDTDGNSLTYDVYLSKTSEDPKLYKSGILTSSYTIKNLENGTTYYWKVVADDSVEKTSSEVRAFITYDNPPDEPKLLAPNDGSIKVSPSSANLKWSCSDLDGDTLTYDLYLSEDATPLFYKSDITQTKYVFDGTLKPNTVYYWRVVAKDGKKKLTPSKIFHFTTVLDNGDYYKWKYKTGDWITSSPAIDFDGTIYVGSEDNYLYAINPDGTLKWKYKTGDWITSSPAIDFDGTIYVGSEDNYLYAINPDGTLKWKYKTGGDISSSSGIASDGTVYVESWDNYLYAINPDGTLKWKYKTGGDIHSSPAIGSDGTIYVGSYDDYLYAINPDGTLKWKYKTGGDIHSSPAIGSDGTIYVGSYDDYLYAINPDGTLKWKYKTGDWITSSPAIDFDGTIYVGSEDNYLYAINPDGTLKWKYKTGGGIDSSPAIASDGTIYVGSNDNYFYAINPDGTLKWKYKTGCDIYSSPGIASDGTVYVGSWDNYLYAIRTNNRGLADSPWPMFGHDLKHSSSISLTKDNNPPAVSLVSPDNNLTGLSTSSITFEWNGSDLDGDTLTYDLYLSEDATPLFYKSDITQTKYVFNETLKSNTVYYWRVVTKDGKGLMTSSKIFSFKTRYLDGTLKWKYGTDDDISSSPAIDFDGTMYVGSGDHYFYAINPDGTLKWKYGTGYYIFSSPAIASDGTVYVGSDDNYLYAINPDGTLKWKYETSDYIYSSPAIASDGTIYVGSRDHYFYAINPDGTLKWKYETSDIIGSSPAIGSDGTIYVGSRDHYFYAINPDGTLKWKYGTGGDIGSSPAIASDGTVYVGSYDDYLYAINPDGTLKWSYKTDSYIFSSPAIASDGTVYVGSYDDYLYAINPDGTLKWKYETSDIIGSSPAIGSDGTVYVGSYDDYLYAINDSNGGLANTPWPMFHHDLKHTGRR